MNSPGKTLTFDAGAGTTKHRIAKIGAADYAVLQAAAVTDPLLGVFTDVDSDSGDRVDVITDGVATVEYGGNVSRGDWLTTDANGKAVTASPAAGVNNQVIGRAVISGVDGDLGSVALSLGQIQGA